MLEEHHGDDLLYRTAREFYERAAVDQKKRVWSEEMNCWGFFAEKTTEVDQFLVICASRPGDMLLIMNEQHVANKEHLCIILDKSDKFEKMGHMISLSFLSNNPMVLGHISMPFSFAYKIAWDLLR